MYWGLGDVSSFLHTTLTVMALQMWCVRHAYLQDNPGSIPDLILKHHFRYENSSSAHVKVVSIVLKEQHQEQTG